MIDARGSQLEAMYIYILNMPATTTVAEIVEMYLSENTQGLRTVDLKMRVSQLQGYQDSVQ
jgi:hypothetical protein